MHIVRTFIPALCFCLSVVSGCSEQKAPVKVFEDVTATSGLGSYTGMTHGAAWGDFDGDGRPDLYVSNHLNDARLYRNLGNGHFEDVTTQWFSPADIGGDKHGAAWADFNNEGRLGLIQLTGADRGVGSEAKRLFVNRGTHFENVAEALGVANAFGRTRQPLWVDIDRDGKLDLFEGAERRFDERTPPFFFLQHDGKFNPGDIATLGSRSVPFCVLAQLQSQAPVDLICRVYAEHKASQVFSTRALPMPEIEALPPTAYEDIAVGDFNNDGWLDVFLARKTAAPKVAFGRPSDRELIGDVWIDQSNVDKPYGFIFHSSGTLDFRVSPAFPPDALSPNFIHIGSRAAPEAMTFKLSPATENISSTPAFEPGKQAGVYISFSAPDKWQVMVSAPREAFAGGKSKYQQVAVRVVSTDKIAKVEPVGEPERSEEAPARLFINHDGRLVEEADKWKINARLVSAANVVAGDFDNDMHLDLFVVASGDIGKQENLLLLNRGDGHFDVVPAAGGAAGPTTGVGDSVTAVDYDGDGFLDLLIATGGSMGRSLGLPSDAGSYRLYHNVGNGNHWLEIDLEGTKSNRDAIGARVDVVAGAVTQVRLQDGGIHNRGQNHSRLHFGLAKNVRADKITVHWPSGTVQELANVSSDQILRIKEP